MDVLEFAKCLAKEAGEIIRVAFYKNKDISIKLSKADLVTETDQYVEKLVQEKIHTKYPDHKFIGEESAADGAKCTLTDDPTWLIDPIDGTSNFVNRFPFCCISIGYYVKQKAEVAVVFNPIMNHMYYAAKGKGAFLNDDPIRVSSATSLEESLILTDWGGDRGEANVNIKKENMARVLMHSRGIRTMGSAALHMCQVASGGGDAFFEFGIHCWDYAAGALIVEEAGGVVVSLDGSPMDLMIRSCIAAASKQLAEEIIPLVHPHPKYERD